MTYRLCSKAEKSCLLRQGPIRKHQGMPEFIVCITFSILKCLIWLDFEAWMCPSIPMISQSMWCADWQLVERIKLIHLYVNVFPLLNFYLRSKS